MGGQVEIIGWLYQYYNTEPKDQAFKKRKYQSKDIPAVTQLFTPDWIVKYLVENSLGHYWIQVLQAKGDTRSEKQLAAEMGWHYLMPSADQSQAVKTFIKSKVSDLKSVTPQDIRLIDVAMGSGHILAYSFDVFLQIYTQEGYSNREAAQLIIQNNLFGLDIDTRAFQLAYFSLMMKARQYHRRFLQLKLRPNIYAIPDSQGLSIDSFRPLITNQTEETQLTYLLKQFYFGKEYGSLVQIDKAIDWESLRNIANQQLPLGQLSLNQLSLEEDQSRLRTIVEVGALLDSKFTIGATNPPYMGSGKMNTVLSKYVRQNYPNSKSDLFAVFMERSRDLVSDRGYYAMITQHAWMFLASFEKLRKALKNNTLLNMAHLGTRAFEEIGGEVVQSTAFILKNQLIPDFIGIYERLVTFNSQEKKEQAYLKSVNNPDIGYLYRTNQANFAKIPGMPIAYWASENLLHDFEVGTRMDDIVTPRQGLATANNNRFLREWYEVAVNKIYFNASSIEDAQLSGGKWFPYNKGGSYRKWYGNYDYVVNWENNGKEIRNFTDSKGKVRSRPQNTDYYFREAITWSLITSGPFSMRYRDVGSIHDVSGMSIFSNKAVSLKLILGLMNSPIGKYVFSILNPTINLQVGNVTSFPVLFPKNKEVPTLVDKCIDIGKSDWDSFETSWNFEYHPLLLHIADEKLAHCRSPIGQQVFMCQNCANLFILWRKNNG